LNSLRQKFIDAYRTREAIKIKINSVKSIELKIKKRLKLIGYIPFQKYLLRRVLAKLEQRLSTAQSLLYELRTKLEGSKLEINFNIDDQLNTLYGDFLLACDNLIKSQSSWYVLAKDPIYPSRDYSWANNQVRRERVNLEKKEIDFIKSKDALLYFGNRFGPDFYFFTGWLMVVWSNTYFSLVNFKDISLNFRTANFIEENEPPSDALVVKYSWKYTNKDGTRDKRYSNNLPIYVVQYGEIHFSTNQGVDELFQFSNSSVAEVFVNALINYKGIMADINLTNKNI
jgi:hypothetical protein